MKVIEKKVEGISCDGSNFEIRNLVIRSSFDKFKFGTVSIADEKKGILLQVTVNDILDAIQKARVEV